MAAQSSKCPLSVCGESRDSPCLSHHPQTGPPGPLCSPRCLHPHTAADADSAPAAPAGASIGKPVMPPKPQGAPGGDGNSSFPQGQQHPSLLLGHAC